MKLYSVDVHAQPLPCLHNEPSGPNPLYVDVRPNLRRIHVLAGDILGALGKRRDVSGVGRNEQDDIRHAMAWMSAHDVTALVVQGAERLHPIILTSLIRQMEAVQIPLWLLHRPPRNDAFMRKLDRLTEPRSLSELPTPDGGTSDILPTLTEPPLPTLPYDDFLSFLPACQQTLPAATATRVEQALKAAASHTRRALALHGATADTISRVTADVLNAAPADSELIVHMRGMQVAAWHHDLYVQIDPARLLTSEERPRLTPAQAEERLCVYRQPYRAITPILTQMGLGVADISTLPVQAASEDGLRISSQRGTLHVGPATARAVRAQLQLLAGSAPTEPLLPHSPKALAKALAEAATDVGVRVYGRRVERTRDHTATSLRALGISVNELS